MPALLADVIAGVQDGFVPTDILYSIIDVTNADMPRYGAKYGRLIKSLMRKHGWRADYPTHPDTGRRRRGFAIGAGSPWLTNKRDMLKAEGGTPCSSNDAL